MTAKSSLASLAQKAHDMRSLLALLQAELTEWQAKLGRSDPESQLVREAGAMYANTQKISDLLGTLVHEGVQQNPASPFDLDHLLQTLIEEYQLAFPKVKFKYTGHGKAMIKGIASDVGILIRNIIENALKYGQSDRKQPVINCGLVLKSKKYEITIADSGPGIARQDLNKVFIPFFRGKNAVLSGSGLGLAIARDIVLQHKGKISIESAEGKGTSVRISLPIL